MQYLWHVHILIIHCLFTNCSPIFCSQLGLRIHSQLEWKMQYLWHAYSLHIHCIFTAYSLLIHYLFTAYSLIFRSQLGLLIHTQLEWKMQSLIHVHTLMAIEESKMHNSSRFRDSICTHSVLTESPRKLRGAPQHDLRAWGCQVSSSCLSEIKRSSF